MSAKQGAVLLAWQRTLNVVVENLLKQLLTVALAQQPLRHKLAVVTNPNPNPNPNLSPNPNPDVWAMVDEERASPL